MLSLQELCMLYHHQGQTQHSKSNDDNQVHVRIVYQQAGGGDAAADNGEVVNRLQSQLHQAGCHRIVRITDHSINVSMSGLLLSYDIVLATTSVVCTFIFLLAMSMHIPLLDFEAGFTSVVEMRLAKLR
jgi:hypothetical protein